MKTVYLMRHSIPEKDQSIENENIPLSLEVNYILKLWLGNFPENTDIFVRIILITSILSCLANPIITSVHATGRLMKFQLYESSILLTILPISYISLKLFKLIHHRFPLSNVNIFLIRVKEGDLWV